MRNRLDLSGRVGVVTGATRGIGAAIAETLAAQGMNLILSGNSSSDHIDARALSIAGAHGVQVQTLLGDISDPETSASLAKLAFSHHRRIDLWVNNAGVLIDGLIGMIPPGDIEKTLAVNVAGVIHGTQAAARVMMREASGSIVNISSIIGRFGNAGMLVYGASKAGVIGATLSSAKELAPKGIRVNAIAPGFIRTDMIAQLSREKFDKRLSSIRMGRVGDPEDIADAVLFLASDLSRYVTGQVIGVDGGMEI